MLRDYILRFVILLIINVVTGILIAIEESSSLAMYVIAAFWSSAVFALLIVLARKTFRQLWKVILSLIILCVSELSLWVLAIRDVLGVDPVVVSTGITSLKFGISMIWVAQRMFKLLLYGINFLFWIPHDLTILIIILSLIGAFYITVLLVLVEGTIYLLSTIAQQIKN